MKIIVNKLPRLIDPCPIEEAIFEIRYSSKIPDDYLLKHEVMSPFYEQAEAIIEVPIVKKIKVKFNKPVKLQFESVENEKGFIV